MEHRGGNREGAGRKTKAEELGLPKLISEVVTDEENKKLFRTLYEKGVEGSFNHAQLYLAYKFGKPQEKLLLSQESKGEGVFFRLPDFINEDGTRKEQRVAI